MQIKCDKCGTIHDTVSQDTAKDGDIEHTFFRCPDCGAVYPIAATDTALRASIAEYSRRRNLVRIKPVTEQFLRETEALKQENLKRCKELMDLHSLQPSASARPNATDILCSRALQHAQTRLTFSAAVHFSMSKRD